MNREELIGLGDASIRKALANMFAILNKDGEILTKVGGMENSDKMVFSPRLECGNDCSVMLFDDEDKARGAIEEILVPQDDGEYHVFKFTAIDDGDGDVDGGYENDFDIEFDSDDGEDEDGVCGDDCQDDENSDVVVEIDSDEEDDGNGGDGTFDSGDMSLDDAIEHAREVGTKMLSENPDCDCGKEHLQLAKWLEELRSIRGANGKKDGSDENDEVEESVSPSVKDIRRVLKRNGYQLVSQKDSKQQWKKEEDEEPIVLPCIEDTFDGTKWNEIVKSRGLTTDFEG